jgi:hypothetical protein
MTWYLFLLLSCGNGCVEIHAISFETKAECQIREIPNMAKCEGRFEG